MAFFVFCLLRPLLVATVLLALALITPAKAQNLAVATVPAIAKAVAPVQISLDDVGALAALILRDAVPTKPVRFHAKERGERVDQGDLSVTTLDGVRYGVVLDADCMDIHVHQSPPSVTTTRHYGVCLGGTVDTGDPGEAAEAVRTILSLYIKK